MVYIYVTKCYHVVLGNKERGTLYFQDELFTDKIISSSFSGGKKRKHENREG